MEQRDRAPAGKPPSQAREQLFQAAAAVGAGVVLAAGARAAAPALTGGVGDIPKRDFGKTGVKVSALGLGEHHLGEAKDVTEAIRIVHEALDAGITFFDNCWEYYNGRSENWMGRALKGKRDKAFLMTKVCTHGRGADLAMKMLDESLRRLNTDHLDLWQVHGVTFDNDPKLAGARGGVLEALDRAKRQGKTRFVGFTGHKDPEIHLQMLHLGYKFDAAQMPLNPCDASFRSFEKLVLPELAKRGMAVLGMKAFGGTADMIKRGLVTPQEALRYAMSLPVTTTISGMDTIAVLRQNLAVARGFKPMTAPEMQALRDRCARLAADGRFETYKVSVRYDNPQAREAHDFPLDPNIKELKDMFKESSQT